MGTVKYKASPKEDIMNPSIKITFLLILSLGTSLAMAQQTGLHLSKEKLKYLKQEQNSSHYQTMVPKGQKKKSGHTISESQAANIARQKKGGKVLKVQALGKSGGYRVKLLLPSGRVTQVTVSASGRIQG